MASLPDSAYCGDSISFSATVRTSAAGKAILRHVDSGKVREIVPSISGSEWTVDVSPLDTAELEPGIYRVALIVDVGVSRSTVVVGTITLKEPLDRPSRESHARKMVAMLERHLEGRIDDDEGRGLETYTIGGVPITKLSFESARNLLEKYRRDVETETVAARAAAGLGTKRRILTRFE
jgi:hypothetical protein